MALASHCGPPSVVKKLDPNRERLHVSDPQTQRDLDRGDFQKALLRAEKALAAAEKAWGPRSSHLEGSLMDLHSALLAAGKQEEASRVQKRLVILRIREDLDWAAAQREEHNDERVIILATRALQEVETQLGPVHPLALESTLLLAEAHDRLAHRAESDKFLDQSNLLTGKLYPDTPSRLAVPWITKGALAFNRGDFRTALTAMDQAVAIQEGHGADVQYINTLFLLAKVQQHAGMPTKAATTVKRGLQLADQHRLSNKVNRADARATLESLHLYFGELQPSGSSNKKYDPAASERMLGKAIEEADAKSLALQNAGFTEVHLRVLHAGALLRLNRKEEAVLELRRAVDELIQTHEEANPRFLEILLFAVQMQLQLHQHQDAEKGLTLAERMALALNPHHPNLPTIHYLKAVTQLQRGEMIQGLDSLNQATSLFDQIQRMFSMELPEESQVNFGLQAGPALSTYLATAIHAPGTDRARQTAAYGAWLQAKGRVLEIQSNIRRTAASAQDSSVRQAAEQLRAAHRQLGDALIAGPGLSMYPEYLDRLDKLQIRKKEAGEKLSQALATTHPIPDAKPITPGMLFQQLKPTDILIDFAKIWPTDPGTFTRQPARYCACVLDGRTQRLEMVDLGSAAKIDSAVRAFQDKVQRGGQQAIAPALQLLGEKLLNPLRPSIPNHTRVFIVPDSQLNLVPFELLPYGHQTGLMDVATVSYLSSAKELLSPPRTARPLGKVLILADPEFGDPGSPVAPRSEPIQNGTKTLAPSRGVLGCTQFKPLAETRREAEGIARLFPAETVMVLQGADATERSLAAHTSPRILHMATHGFFAEFPAHEAPVGQSEGRPDTPDLQDDPLRRAVENNPLSIAGLALAGANHSINSGEAEGLLTADKVLDLDCSNTELVVLSACNTGGGEIHNGEGVFGLKRAFALSGAHAMIVSLWKVPDRETRALMIEFYRHWLVGNTKASALAEAKRVIQSRQPDPFFWAAFVLTGDPD